MALFRNKYVRLKEILILECVEFLFLPLHRSGGVTSNLAVRRNPVNLARSHTTGRKKTADGTGAEIGIRRRGESVLSAAAPAAKQIINAICDLSCSRSRRDRSHSRDHDKRDRKDRDRYEKRRSRDR